MQKSSINVAAGAKFEFRLSVADIALSNKVQLVVKRIIFAF